MSTYRKILAVTHYGPDADNSDVLELTKDMADLTGAAIDMIATVDGMDALDKCDQGEEKWLRVLDKRLKTEAECFGLKQAKRFVGAGDPVDSIHHAAEFLKSDLIIIDREMLESSPEILDEGDVLVTKRN